MEKEEGGIDNRGAFRGGVEKVIGGVLICMI